MTNNVPFNQAHFQKLDGKVPMYLRGKADKPVYALAWLVIGGGLALYGKGLFDAIAGKNKK
eukprot:TRINITY_DN267_c0_g1_i1.p1 TRINITY_DN267_c0_g1~~TRINITY_DN267_c0_g1_i1.p1  ORF type:complete len:61 (+),score=33.29 TRINITY_DN267_c0_g1_i1:91-273(+)